MRVWPSGDLVATVEIGCPPDNFFEHRGRSPTSRTPARWLRGSAFLLLIALTIRQGMHRAREERLRADQARAAGTELAELKGRLAQMTEITSLRQEELTRTLNDRLDRVGQTVGTSVAQITEAAAQRQEELARTMNHRLDRPPSTSAQALPKSPKSPQLARRNWPAPSTSGSTAPPSIWARAWRKPAGAPPAI